MRKLFTALLTVVCSAIFAAEVLVGPVLIQRRNDIEIVMGVENEVGEITYSRNDDTATLRVGTSDSGTLIVSDPAAVHFVPVRELQPDEWYIEYGAGVVAGQQQSIIFWDGTMAWANTNRVRTATIRPVDQAIKLVSTSFSALANVGNAQVTTTETEATIEGIGWGSPEGMPMSPLVIVSNIAVRAYASARTDATIDLTLHRVSMVDSMGSIDWGNIRSWTTSRYDRVTAPAWSAHPALSAVRLSRQSLRFDSSSALHMSWKGATAADGWAVYQHGFPTLNFEFGGSESGSTIEGFDIVSLSVVGGNVVLDIAQGAWGAVSVQQTSDSSAPAWALSGGQTSNYPATVTAGGRPCHRVTFPAPAGDRWFFRAVATMPGTRNSIEVDFCDFKISSRAGEYHAIKAAPASADATGLPGETRWTDGYIYVCTATNTWKRAALTTWP